MREESTSENAQNAKENTQKATATAKGKKMKARYNITFERVNEEEAMAGDTDRRGFLAEGVTLSEAVSLLTDGMDEISAMEDCGRWFTVYGRSWHDGDNISISLHPCGKITEASRARLFRALKNGNY